MVKYVRAIKDFSGGLSEVANDNIPDNRLITAKNVVPGDGYGIQRASGTSIAFSKIPTDQPVRLLVNLGSEASPHLIAATGSSAEWRLWRWLDHGWVPLSVSQGVYGIAPIKDWFIYNSNLFWVDGSNFWCYDRVEIAPVPHETNSGQSGYVSPEFWNRLCTSISVAQNASRWFFATPNNEIIVSEVGKYNEFRETNILRVLPEANDTITALHEFNDGLLIFLRRSVYFLAGWDFLSASDIRLTKLSVESGTRYPKTIKTISNAVLYLGENAVYRLSLPYFTSSIAAANISDKQITQRLGGYIYDAWAEVFNGVYHLSIDSTISGGPHEYRYYLDSESWWGEYTQGCTCYGSRVANAEVYDGAAWSELSDNYLFLGCRNGYVLFYDDTSTHYISADDGGVTSIPVEVVTKGYDVVGQTVVDSKVKRVFLVLRQYDTEKTGLEVQVKTDYAEGAFAAKIDSMTDVLTAVLQDVEGDESMVWSKSLWAGAYWGWIGTVTKMFQVNRKCKRIQFIFRDDNSDEPLLIYGIALLFKKKKPKGSRMGVSQRAVRYDD